jgi:cytochrome c553
MFDPVRMFGACRISRLTCCAVALLLCLGRPSSAEAAGDLAAGRVKAKACAVCHGIDGIAKRPGTPHLAGQIAFYTAEQLRRYRSGRRAHPEMNVVAQGLNDQDIDDLARYYAAITITVELPK